MLELYLPYLIAVMMGLSAGPEEVAVNELPQTTDVTVESADAGGAFSEELPQVTDSTLAGRTPEPQVATGQYTTALEVKPILGMTKLQWAAISHEGGNDLLYFSNLLAWRCGLWEIRYGINGEPATNVLEMEPCHENTASPNSMVDIVNFPIWVTYPGESIQTLRIEVTFDDGTEDFVEVDRTRIVLP